MTQSRENEFVIVGIFQVTSAVYGYKRQWRAIRSMRQPSGNRTRKKNGEARFSSFGALDY